MLQTNWCRFSTHSIISSIRLIPCFLFKYVLKIQYYQGVTVQQINRRQSTTGDMKKRMTLFLTLVVTVIIITGFTLANTWQDRQSHNQHGQGHGQNHQNGHNHDHGHDHHQSHQGSPMELNSVMRLLMLDLHTINEGIFTQDFDLIISGAASITDHPQLSENTLTLLEETLGDQLSVFEGLDHTAHMYADSIRQAAEDANMERVLNYYRSMEQSCIACHAAFQDRLRLARLNSR